MITPIESQASFEDDAMFNGIIGIMEAYISEDEAARTSIKKAKMKILCRDYNVQLDASNTVHTYFPRQ